MADAVLDSSAVLAFLFAEPGFERVQEAMPRSMISTVNVTEVISKLIDRGVPIDLSVEQLGRLRIETVPFDAETAHAAGLLREKTRLYGLSLADRACLALAQREGLPALTADQSWAEVDIGVAVELIR